MGLSILSVKSTRFIISYKRCISTFSIRSSLILLSYLLCSITCLSASSSRKLSRPLPLFGGGKEVRTPDPLLAKQVLSQLSYTPA